MSDFPIHKRIYYRWLGFVFGFTYWTRQHRFLGFRISTIVIGLAFVPLASAWRQNSGQVILALAALLGLWALWLYWRARRAGYMRFVAGETAVALTDDPEPAPPNQRIHLRASGIFGVSDREEQMLMSPAEYWRVPMGEHTVMVQPEPGRFLYQFFNAAKLQNLQQGWLVHGWTPQSVLAVTFFSDWGKETISLRALYQGSDAASRDKKRRTIYLCFDDKADERAVWHTILFDAREKRKMGI